GTGMNSDYDGTGQPLFLPPAGSVFLGRSVDMAIQRLFGCIRVELPHDREVQRDVMRVGREKCAMRVSRGTGRECASYHEVARPNSAQTLSETRGHAGRQKGQLSVARSGPDGEAGQG